MTQSSEGSGIFQVQDLMTEATMPLNWAMR